MLTRLRILGIVLIAAGLGVAGAGFLYGAPQADDGLDSAQAMYASQGVTLSYDEQGRLIDRGSPEGAQAILALLEKDWDYPVKHANLDPGDPLVNTRDELMFQYATITYHVLHGTRAVTLTEEQVPITYRGVEYTEAGVYQIEVGAYFGQLDRTHPIEGQLREAWTAQALALTSFLAAGHANQAAGELAMATSLGIGAVGVLFALAGGGLVWATFGASPAPSPTHRAPAATAVPVAPAARVANGSRRVRQLARGEAAPHGAGGPAAAPARSAPRPVRPVPASPNVRGGMAARKSADAAAPPKAPAAVVEPHRGTPVGRPGLHWAGPALGWACTGLGLRRPGQARPLDASRDARPLAGPAASVSVATTAAPRRPPR